MFKSRRRNNPERQVRILEKERATGTDERVYGDLIYRCRACGEEFIIPDVPNFGVAIHNLIEGNQAQIFMTTNFYYCEDNNTYYKSSVHHKCQNGDIGYAELIKGVFTGQKYLNKDNVAYDPTKEQGF